jgi:hypothetical protein
MAIALRLHTSGSTSPGLTPPSTPLPLPDAKQATAGKTSSSILTTTDVSRKHPALSQKEKDTAAKKDWSLVKDDPSHWKTHGRYLAVNKILFAHGILAVRPTSFSGDVVTSEREFAFGSRTLSVYETKNKEDKSQPDAAATRKTKHLLNELQKYPERMRRAEVILTVVDPMPRPIAEKISAYADEVDLCAKQKVVIFNPHRREEVFLPLTFQTGAGEKMGTYVYPWLSQASSGFKFCGFEQFVTAGCMFGSSLKGRDQNNAAINIIKHNITFCPEQIIMRVEESETAYEEMVFFELEQLACLIDNLSKPNQPKRLIYHLPYCDYMLFGIELFIRGRMILNALDQFLIKILQKRDEYIETVREICQRHGIEVVIESPFENLFARPLVANSGVSVVVLGVLGLSSTESTLAAGDDAQRESERNLVHLCLKLLQNNPYNPTHQTTWRHLAATIEMERMNTLEDLFKIANAVMVARAARGRGNYEVCSLLPLSEKQIPLGYAEHIKRLSKSSPTTEYPAIFNVTYLDPLVTYSSNPDPTTTGLAFYFDLYQSDLVELTIKIGLLHNAHKNVALTTAEGIPCPVERLLPPASPNRRRTPPSPPTAATLSPPVSSAKLEL